MKVTVSLASIVAVAGLACSALAQDSVSNKYNGTQQSGLPGDGLNTWTTGAPYQVSNYAVDMAPIYTSCGTRFGIAPLFKSTKTGTNFFGSLTSAQSLSQTTLGFTGTVATTYSEWIFSAGAGIHPTQNNAGSAVNPVAWTPYGFNQFAATMAEFATDDGGKNTNNVVTAVVNFAPERPGRLWVTRVVAAVNEGSSGAGDSSQFGIGGIDADGNTFIRADNFGATGPNQISGMANYYRVKALSRNATKLGLISSVLANGDSAATDGVLLGSATQHNTPNCLPADLAGVSTGRLLGSNFGTNFVYESSLNTLTSTTTHRAGTLDHRGGVNFSQVNLFGGVGTAAIIGKSTASSGDPADRICTWAVNASGSVGTQYTLTVPIASNITDSCYSYSLNSDGLSNYSSQVAARGGNGQIAIGKDQAGRGLLGAFITQNRGSLINPWNGVAVCRFNPVNPTGTAAWSLAAWTDTPNFTGKSIKGDYGQDGIPFTSDTGEFDGVCDANDAPIGRLASMSELGIGLVGPSISNPVFDSVGNVWFIATVALNKSFGTDFDSALIRATYDPSAFCYDLELVMELGDTFDAPNSGLRYQVQFMEIADSNSIGSGTMTSSCGTQGAWNNLDPTSFADTSDPRAMGGIVVAAKIVYDVDGDGDWQDPSGTTPDDPNSPDEAYRVLLYIGNTSHGCPADFDGNGFVNGDDFDFFSAAFIAGDGAADFDGNFFVNGDDFDLYSASFEAGC